MLVPRQMTAEWYGILSNAGRKQTAKSYVLDEESGLYPLTEDLKYIIQMRGDHYGWFDTGKGGYIFLDGNGNPISGINHDISWLFMCGYLEN